MTNSLRAWFVQFWFGPASATGLAVMRLASGGYALYYLYTRYSMLIRIAGNENGIFEPVGVARLLDAPLPVNSFGLLLCLTLTANLAFVLGFAHKVSGPLFAGLLLAVLCYRNSWGMIYHSHNLLVLHVLILGFTRAADVFSIDQLLRTLATRCRGTSGQSLKWPHHWRYGWPVRLICSVTSTTYLLAGIAKILGPQGWHWISGSAIRNQIAVDAVRKELLGGRPSELASQMYDHVGLFAVLGIGALVLELGAPAAMFGKWAGRAWAIAAFLFHWGVFFIMGITFRYQLCGAALVSFFVTHRESDTHGRRKPRSCQAR